MPKSCAVKDCHSGSLSDTQERVTRNIRRTSLFQAPRCPVRRQEWCDILKLENLNPTDYVCELHFRDSDVRKSDIFTLSGKPTRVYYLKRTLVPNATPIFLDEASVEKIREQYRIALKYPIKFMSNDVVLYADGVRRHKPIELEEYAQFCKTTERKSKKSKDSNIYHWKPKVLKKLVQIKAQEKNPPQIESAPKENVEEIHVIEHGEVVKYSIQMLDANEPELSQDEHAAMQYDVEEVLIDDEHSESEQFSIETSETISNQRIESVWLQEEHKSKNQLTEILDNFKAVLPQGWTYFEKPSEILFVYFDPHTLTNSILLRCDSKLRLQVSFNGRPEFSLGVKVKSTQDIYNRMIQMHRFPLCEGTQLCVKYSRKCNGLIDFHKLKPWDRTIRCVDCRILRRKLIASNKRKKEMEKRNEKISIDKSSIDEISLDKISVDEIYIDKKTDHEDHTYSTLHAPQMAIAESENQESNSTN